MACRDGKKVLTAAQVAYELMSHPCFACACYCLHHVHGEGVRLVAAAAAASRWQRALACKGRKGYRVNIFNSIQHIQAAEEVIWAYDLDFHQRFFGTQFLKEIKIKN